MADWRREEQTVQQALETLVIPITDERAMDIERIFKLARTAHSLYISQDPSEKAKLLKRLFWNCSVDAVSATPTYRKPFDMIFERGKTGNWSGLVDDFRNFPFSPEI